LELLMYGRLSLLTEANREIGVPRWDEQSHKRTLGGTRRQVAAVFSITYDGKLLAFFL
jgi:hypothetical protein